jgi:DNA polymerase IV
MFVQRVAGILHADADAFYASVEQRDDPALRGKPVAVGGGVVLAASYEARAHGVRGGMGGRRARALCPGTVFVEPRWPAYVEASRALFSVFEETAPVVEGLSLEEAFLDVRGMGHFAGSPPEIAARLKREVLERVGLRITVGVARTKHLAKVASRIGKPDGLLVVPVERETAFLHPLRVEELWGVGPATAAKLNDRGLHTVGEVARLAEHELVAIVGRAAGRKLHALAHNEDRRRVSRVHSRRSVGSQCALGPRPRSGEEIDAVIVGLVDRVTRRMRAGGRVGRTVVLRLRFGDYSRATRSHTLPYATAESETILSVLRALLRTATPTIERRGLTLLGLAVTNLGAANVGVQLALPLDRRPRAALDAALDDLRDRFGPKVVRWGSQLARDPGLSAYLIPSGRIRGSPRPSRR